MAASDIATLQPKLVRQFASVIARGQLSQAYVFNGASGTGKHDLAVWIALRLFCEHVQENGEPDYSCSECQRVLTGNHPDVVILQTTLRSLKVDDIRDMKAEMAKTGVERNQRVFIIDDADKMTAQAANSLLKFYEEPVPGMVIILTTTAKNQLLPTILSRAQVINFPPPRRETVIAALDQSGVAPSLAAAAAALSADVQTAQTLAADETFQQQVAKVQTVIGLVAAHDDEAFVQVQTTLVPLAPKPADQQVLLSLIALVYQDALNQHFHAKVPATFGGPLIELLADQSEKQLAGALSAVLMAQVQLSQNVTFQSTTEQLILTLLEG
ncbi:DNA polymerase III subunit delta' [Lacticaseibacillus yichunensis]|uniref:DNA polymerase III subunit delta n=1 Tax=Lacticaseibacillus yichunensis TaxID=2486015 RepID=A0ABW4CK34_9LACO|nr:DNA polymerase III subunit delta' [Lacticaseibacillus yichunensis]